MTLTEAIAKYPNDYDLGHYFTVNYESLEDFNEFQGPVILRDHPNFYELGNYLRNEFVNENPFN